MMAQIFTDHVLPSTYGHVMLQGVVLLICAAMCSDDMVCRMLRRLVRVHRRQSKAAVYSWIS